MNLKNLVAFSDQFPSCISPRKKLVSGFGLGVVSFFIVLCVVFFNVSLKNPISINPVFQGFSINSNSSFVAWSFSFSRTSPNATSSSSSSSSSRAIVVENSTTEESVKSNDTIINLGDTHLSNFTQDVKNGSLNEILEGNSDLKHSHLKNSSVGVKNGSFNGISQKPVDGEVEIGGENSNVSVKSVDLDHADSNTDEGVFKKNFTGKDDHMIPPTVDLKNDGECDIFDGRWVRDDTKPYYPAGSCPYIDKDFNCHLNKRPDNGFVKWKWQPFGCEIPSLNATDFLERLRGKKLVFVGDSLNRNMWESLVCILRQSLRYKRRVYEISGRREFKKKGFYAFRFEDYNCTVDFVASPFLVRESSYSRKNGSIETLRLDLMDRTTSMYQDADILVFNSGHWWTHEKTSRGEDYYQEGNHVYPRLKVLDAYTRALSTWARWVDKNIDSRKTHVIFRGYSVTHFRGGQWNSGGQCHKETEPIFNTTHLSKYPSKMRAFDHVLHEMKTPVIYLNISRLTDYRKDGHPSIYRMRYNSIEEQIAAEHTQDCSHWCLPGVPDTWNELLYASLLKVGTGSWKS